MRAGALSVAERSYPTSEVRGSGLECQAATAQERLRAATLCPRSGVAAGRSYPASEVGAAGRRHPASEVRAAAEKSYRASKVGAAGRSHPRPRPGPAAGRSIPRSGGCAGTGGPRGAIPR